MASQLKSVFDVSKPQSVPRKDKLAQTKLREREIHEALRNQRQARKLENEERRQAQLSEVRQEREFHETKRAAKDRRQAAKRAAHAATGQWCEHGVWRCKICFPHKTGKPLLS